MRAFWVFIILVSIMVGWFGSEASSAKQLNWLNDVSWPNCGVNLPKNAAGIVGVNGGLALRPNPCLRKEAAGYKNLSLYVNTGYPGSKVAQGFQAKPKVCAADDKICRAYNYGYSSAIYDIRYALMSGVIAKYWWLDVETENSWDSDYRVNRAALSGTLDALGKVVGRENLGFYSYPGQWDRLTNKWRNNYPAWVATGSSELAAAFQACLEPSFTGGPVIYTQYTESLDINLSCRLVTAG